MDNKCRCNKLGRKQIIDRDGKAQCATCGKVIKHYPSEDMTLNGGNLKCIKSSEPMWLPMAWCSASTNVKIYDD